VHECIAKRWHQCKMIRTLIIILMFSGLLKLFGCIGQQDDKQSDQKTDEILASGEDFKNRPVYKDLTKEILNSTSDEQLEQTIFDNISQIIGTDYENELDKVQKLTDGQKAIYSTWLVEGEVNNGGFNQFYFNSSGSFAEMAVNGFEVIGAKKFAGIMKRANELYKSIKDELEKHNDGTLESFSESYEDNPLNDLDTEFYKLYEDENLSDLKTRYIRSNIDEFIKE